MNKLSNEQIEKINKNMIVNESEKAIQLKVTLMNKFTGVEKISTIWCPKSCVELTECGILKIKDWFKKNKENDLRAFIAPVIEY